MTKPSYDASIDVQPVRPPVGGKLRFAAKVSHLHRTVDGKRERLQATSAPPFQEFLGVDRGAAHQKAANALRAWVEQQGGTLGFVD